MIRRCARRRGFTLAELLVVIVILGVMAAITGVAFTTKSPVPAADAVIARLASVRDSAVRSGHAVTTQFEVEGEEYLATAFPDGRVVTDAPVSVSSLSGRNARALR